MIENVVSRRAFSGGSSGTYNVQALELAAAAREKKLKGGRIVDVTVRFLDDTDHVFHVEKRAKGNVILEQVYQHLELVEKDYFGLQYSEDGCTPSVNKPEFMRWLDPSKQIKKQLHNCQYPLYFRVKFYVSDPSKLQEEYTRYQFYLQLRKDIWDQRLVLSPSTAILLASYMVQSELGDYQPEEHGPDYLSNLLLVPGQCEEMERKISELHKLHKGQLPADAEFNFLDHAKRIDMYGVELHKAKDNAGKEIQIGVTHIGLVVFQNNIRYNTFSWSKIMKISFKRKEFFIQLRRELSENYDTVLGFNMESYRSSKTLWKACVEHHTFFRLHSPKIRRRFLFTLGSKFTYSGRTEFQTVSEVKQRSKLERRFVRSPSRQLIRQSLPPSLEDKGKLLSPPGRPPRPYDNKVTSLGSKEPRRAWGDDSHISDDDGGFLERTLEGPFSPGIAGRVISYADEELPSPLTSNGGGLYDTPPYSASHSPASHITDEEGLVTINLQTDEDDKYGFNIKGGTSRDVPILVSRVAPNTPADRCTPRLSEGDQIVQINNVDVSRALYHDCIKLIQDSRLTNEGKLVLVVKPNVLLYASGQDDLYAAGEEEPPYRYVPAIDVGDMDGDDSRRAVAPSIGNALEQSMLLLADGLASGTLMTRYETLYRKHPDMACEASAEAENVNKNRYRDISPYDATRVILRNASSGDYINANYVNMRINGTDIVNKYIATQGPLQSTTEDFWQMILEEEECQLIVMLTTLVERGRTKCHKYWPDLKETLTMPNVIVECTDEETDSSGSFVFRDFVLTDVKDGKERKVKHMQYLAWPDHGVPDSPAQFLSFTNRVRELRGRNEEEETNAGDDDVDDADATRASPPVVVHCSAGIGRTGVLILMETAMCLIEANEPVYPLEIVRTMREQRAMMIQNASQYRFVCESVHAAYLERSEIRE